MSQDPIGGGSRRRRLLAMLAALSLFASLLIGCGEVQRRPLRPSMVGVVEEETDHQDKQSQATENLAPEEPAAADTVKEPQMPARTPARTREPEYRVSRVTASDAKAGASLRGDLLLVPLDTYFRVEHRIEFMKIDHAMNLYKASNGSFPKSHDEFIKDIIRANSINLPELDQDWEYFYDAEDSTLKKRKKV